VDRFDEEADQVLGRHFANLREETLILVRPAGALAARRAAEQRYRRRLLAFAAGVVALLLTAGGGGYALAGGRGGVEPAGRPTVSPSPSVGSGEGGRLPSSTEPTGVGGSPGVGPAGGPVPPGLLLESVTFIDVDSAWALGWAPCLVAQPWSTCPAVVRSRDGGKTWVGVPVPGHAAAYLGDVRFATDKDGWVVARAPLVPTDPGVLSGALYATHDGGSTWAKVALPDPVLRVETAGGRVWVSTGTAGASQHAIYSASIHSDTFTKVTDAPGTELAVHGRYAYVYGAGTGLVVLKDGARTTRTVPCDRDHRSTVLLAASGDQSLAVLCGGQPSGPDQDKAVFTSTDGGATWAAAGTPDRGGQATSLAATTGDIFVAGSGMPVRARGTDGSWAAVLPPPGPDDGFGFVGFTDDTHGIALALRPSGEFEQTADGGRTWTQRLPS
jgi:photosystem II stability/assembly factor-like uncharacterized protein